MSITLFGERDVMNYELCCFVGRSISSNDCFCRHVSYVNGIVLTKVVLLDQKQTEKPWR